MKVVVKKQIHGCFAGASSLDRYVYKEFDLPFPPTPAIGIMHKTKAGETDDIDIEEVWWDVDTQSFLCFAHSDKEIYEAELHKQPHRPIEEIVKEYVDADWILKPKS